MRANAAPRERNRLHRRTERLEDVLAWLAGVLLVVALGVAFLVGASLYDDMAVKARAEAADRWRVGAVLVEDARPVAGSNQAGTAPVTVHWTGRDGLERTGRTVLQGIHRAGDTVVVWEDRTGRLVRPPLRPGEAAVTGITVGLVVAMLGVGLVELLRRGLFAWTGRRFARAWEQEWAQVGPEWTRRTRS